MSQFQGVNYEVPAYASSPAPSAPMISRSQAYQTNMDPNLAMDPDLTQLLPHAGRNSNDFMDSIHGQGTPYQLQLQAAAANEAALAGEIQSSQANGEVGSDLGADRGVGNGVSGAAGTTPKNRRLGRACDACSKRKVKCGEEVPCKNCVDIDIQCTFSRPTKRRGPANRVAEGIKRVRVGGEDGETLSSTTQGSVGMDAIAPHDKLATLVFDFFTFLGPIYPFPPEALVMSRLEQREDQVTKSFTALVASMLALLAASFPRLVRDALPGVASNIDHFSSRCAKLSLENRPPVRESTDADVAATCFFLGIVSHLKGRSREFTGHMMDSLSIIRANGVLNNEEPINGAVVDPISKEMCIRIFWSIYTTTKSLPQTPEIASIIPLMQTSGLPPLPSLSDSYTFMTQLDGPNAAKSTLIQGFNIMVQAHVAFHPLQIYVLLDDEARILVRKKGIDSIHASLESLSNLLNEAQMELSALPIPGYYDSLALHQRGHAQLEILKLFMRTALLKARLTLTEALEHTAKNAQSQTISSQYAILTCDLAALLKSLSPSTVEPCKVLITPMLRDSWHTLGKRPMGLTKAILERAEVKADLAVCGVKWAELFDGDGTRL
ncbi:hypothetical protein EJ08DRAFT_737880 [Tothia fuscella]|uniref:Zn(2)-C6 fungal-type domain-containing protein n=1 Tax=Tothia fuscella TaxID=1048955 RepID=A0A9P4TUQ0_9PEZI|nr:hypothetical protein EJ08DRAFT_737880 [Tothia fuscella]